MIAHQVDDRVVMVNWPGTVMKDIVSRLILFKILIIFLDRGHEENEGIRFKVSLKNDLIGLLKMEIIVILLARFHRLSIPGNQNLISI